MKKIVLILALLVGFQPLALRETHATVAETTARNDYNGNGTTTTFAYTFRVIDQAHLRVLLNGTLQTITTNYTVTGVGAATGSVVFVTPPANAAKVIILRAQPPAQPNQYLPGTGISNSRLESDLDRGAMVDQMQQEQLSRTLRYGETQIPTDALTTIPAPVAGKCIGFDGAGTALELNDCGGAGGGAAFTTSAELAGLVTDETGTGAVVFAGSPTFTTQITTPKVVWTGALADWQGAGSPEGVITGAIGSTYRRTDGGASTSFYVKESGAGNTGWVAYGTPAGSGAPTTSTYITQTADGTLSAEQALSSLATGVVKVTTGTGALSTAVVDTDYLSPASVLTNSNLPTTITGKTFGNTNTYTAWDTLFTLQDNADATKQMKFELGGYTTGLTRTLTPPNADTHLLGGSHFAGTHIGVMKRTGTALYAVCRNNDTATTDPGTGNDNTQNYCIDSSWANTSAATLWKAVSVGTGTASWVRLGTAVTPALQAVSDVGRTITNAISFATAVKTGSATSGNADYDDPTLGPIRTSYGPGGENDVDWKRKLNAGKVFEIQNSAGTPILTVAEATAAVTNLKVDCEAAGNTCTTVQYASINAASCNNATAAPGMNLPTANAPTPTCFGTTTTQGTLTFADAATQTATRNFILRPDWTGTVDVDLVWFANAASANAVRWSVATGCTADGEATNVGPAAYNTASTADTAYTGTANQRKTTAITAVAVTNCSAGESMTLQVQRIGAHANDTLAASAELLLIGLKTRAAQ